MNSTSFRGMQLLDEWPEDCKFGSSLLLAWLALTLVSYIPYYIKFRFNNGSDISSFIAYIVYYI